MKILELLKNHNGIAVYHGSNTQINNFVTDFVGGSEANDLEGPGIYFTNSESDAVYYGEHIHKAILKPRKLLTKNPRGGTFNELIKLAKMAPEWEYTAQNWDENPHKGIVKAINDFIKYNDNQKDRFLQVWIDFYKYEPVQYVQNCVKLGYDGIVVNKDHISDGIEVKHYIIYNPAIIEKVG